MDTHKVVKLLETRGFSEDQAEALMEAAQEVSLPGVATKSDIQDVRLEIQDVRNDIQDIRGEIVGIHGELNLLRWMIGFSLAMSMAILLKLFVV